MSKNISFEETGVTFDFNESTGGNVLFDFDVEKICGEVR